MSLDGKIATRKGDSKISSEKDLILLHELRGKVDAIMVGINTVLVDDPILTNRSGRGKAPARIVIDSFARIPKKARMLQNLRSSAPRTIIVCAETAPREKTDELASLGARILRFGSGNCVDLPALISYLPIGENVHSVLLEGGGELNWSMLSQGLVDEVRVTVSPRIIGGRNATQLVSGEGVCSIEESLKLNLESVKAIESTGEIILSYSCQIDNCQS